MSASFLEKLKRKPEPLVKESVAVKIVPRKKVVIEDKRGEKTINRAEVLRKMREPRQPSKDIPKRVEEPPKDMPKQDEEPPKDMPKKIKKKTGKRLKIVGIEKGTISTIPAPAPEPEPVKKSRISKKPDLNVVIEGKTKELVVGKTINPDLLPQDKPKVLVRASEYYLNNRQIFVNFINKLFSSYREQILKEKEEAEVEEGSDILEQKCSRGMKSF